MVKDGIKVIDKTKIVEKFKIWCLHFMMKAKPLWRLLVYEESASIVESVKRKNYTSKWLSMSPGLTDVALTTRSAYHSSLW